MTSWDGPVVIDTSVVSILFRGDRHPRFSFYANRLDGRRGLISFQTLEERLFGAAVASWGSEQVIRLNAHLDQYDVVWPDRQLVEASVQVRAARRRAGLPISTADAWIAATALQRQCPLATDDRDFSGIPNLELIQFP